MAEALDQGLFWQSGQKIQFGDGSMESDELVNEIEQRITTCERFLSQRLNGGTRDLYAEIGGIVALIDELRNRIHAQPDPHILERITHWENSIARMKEDGLTLSLQENKSEIARRKEAETMTALFAQKVNANLKTSVRHVLLASATAMVASLTAISQAWDSDIFVIIVSNNILFRFTPALFCAGLAEFAYNTADSKMWGVWQRLTAIQIEGSENERKTLLRSQSLMNWSGAIALGVSVGLVLSGIIGISQSIVDAKTAPKPAVSAPIPSR